MHIVDVVHSINALQTLLNLSNVQVRWYTLQDQHDALPESQSCRPQYNYRENVRANRVHIPILRPNVHDHCSDDHTHGVKQVAKDVQESSLDVQVVLSHFLCSQVLNVLILLVIIIGILGMVTTVMTVAACVAWVARFTHVVMAVAVTVVAVTGLFFVMVVYMAVSVTAITFLTTSMHVTTLS